ncbi:hypothetical protein ACYHQC_003671 [Aeromonas salmonicida]|uniref:hypothetical protein n=1 Tax=Aeromonas salmonicida TaxID=645 RepID=UPI003CF1DEBE
MQKMTHRLTLELRRLASENHDHCVSCNYQFKEGDTSHLGYGKSNVPLYVCDACSKQLKETAIRHYFSPRPYSVPEPSSKLWRYMDFTKYVSLLSSGGLYFARANCFEDTFEGAKGLKRNKARWDDYYLKFFRAAIENPPKGYECKLSNSEIDEQAQKLLRDMEVGGEYHRKRTFISCWHASEHESEAMWRLYSSFLSNAVAVRTSYESLYMALGQNPSISIGRIEYIDMKESYAGVNDAFWRKRKYFEHEREVRAIVTDFESQEIGKIIPCDLSVLIEEVFVSPKAPSWFVDLVNDVNDKYSVKVKVSSSELIEEPFF